MAVTRKAQVRVETSGVQSKAFINILSYNFPSRSSEKAQFCVETHSLRPSHDPPIPLSGAYPRPWKSHLRPSKVAPTTLQSPCQELTYDWKSHLRPSKVAPTYDPPKLRLRPSNPLVRSLPTTLEVAPTTLQSCVYDPPIPLSGAYLRPWSRRPFSHFGCLQSLLPTRKRGKNTKRKKE